MIQRIQSIYLLIATILLSLLYFMPLAVFLNGDVANVFTISGVKTMEFKTYPLLMLVLVIMIITLISIFLYKNRPLQIKLGKLTIFLLCALSALMFYYTDSIETILGNLIKANYKPAIVFPIISIILVFLANKAIKKDDDLVRSADRLR